MSGDLTAKPTMDVPVDAFEPRLINLGDNVITRQKQKTFRQTCRNHWRAVVWSLTISTALYMEGYDTGLVGATPTGCR